MECERVDLEYLRFGQHIDVLIEVREPYDPFLDINQQFGELELHPFHDPARRMASQRHQTIAPERYNPRRDLLLPHIQIEEMLGEGLFVVHKVVGGQGANDYE